MKKITRKSYGVYAGLAILLFALMFPAVSADTAAESGYITVGLAPVASFDALYAYNTVPAVVTFRDHSTGTTPMTYAWEFGDGATSTEQNPKHTYMRKGLYTVRLTVTNFYGSSTETKQNYVSIGMAPNAGFSGEPTSGNAPLTVAFTDRSSGYPTMWNWNFGDGQESVHQNPVHTYWVGGDYTVTLTASNDYGATSASKPYYVHVMPPLTAKFTADPKSGIIPLVVKFTDMSTGSPESWTWDFNDGSTSTGPNPVHAFTTAGSFDITLTVTRGMDKDSTTQTIIVGGVPSVDFVADSTTVSVNTPVKFTDKTLNSPTAWSWDFGDGTTSSEQNPTRVYSAKGVYTVTLTATNSFGKDTEKKVNYITVGIPPMADFITEIPSYQEGSRTQYVRFIDTSIGNPYLWSWDFGDGTNFEGQSPPLHLYNRDGLYTVSLTVKNPFGEDTETKTNLISVREGPRIDFKADRTRVSVNQYVHFTDLSTNNPSDWKWDFGDGSSGTGMNPDHAYRQVGVYTVRLTASDGYTTNSLTKKGYITVVNLPNAEFVADKTKGITPFTVHFTDMSTGNPTGWKWDFGDGATSTDQNPSHVYTTSGTSVTSRYTVSLTATNINGENKKTKADYITVTQTPIAEFTVDDRQGKAPFIVKFRDLSAGMPTSWAWEFGDAGTSNEQNPTHVYPFEGSYDVRLTVSNQYGSDTVFKTGTSSQRNNAAPVPLTTMVTPEPTTAPLTVIPTDMTTSAPTPLPTATKSPLSPFVTVGASVIGLLVLAAAQRK
ncbi:MAG TPA: PKD domain-containing protein [Methanoregula sp.]|nr:PKD domain-containing protein [Methanoregula sp.]